MEDDETRRLVAVVATARTESEAEEAWVRLRLLGVDVVPYLAAAYPTATRYQGRVRLVFHSIRYARTSQDAFGLGMEAVSDRATLVRYRACQVLAYSLRHDAIRVLRDALGHPDRETAEDARAAIRAITAGNHHLFVDRTESGSTRWIVNPEDDQIAAQANSSSPTPDRWYRRLLRR
ncbi:hypothetical protein [Paractinoplanes globisporus]|uniref:HEAT repeat domain-containing protein n=1 Tax=Paractinoplanes globisporus TaxID=113565 RepID=A0ABW6WFZ3_9ACTN|nr:hypothetical protein [Actinoplanes globisporus]